MSSTETDKITKKIKSLLSLAGNNPNENERNEAFQKAQSLLARHNLTMAQINFHDFEGEPINTLQLDVKVEPWRTLVLDAVSKIYYIDYYFSSGVRPSGFNKRRWFVLVGTDTNIMTAKEIFSWLALAIKKEATRQYPESSYGIQSTRKALIRSFCYGAAKSLIATANAIKKEELEALNSGDNNVSDEVEMKMGVDQEEFNQRTCNMVDFEAVIDFESFKRNLEKPTIPVTDEIVAKAWELRRKKTYTMREIADMLGVHRSELIAAMDQSSDDSVDPEEEPEDRYQLMVIRNTMESNVKSYIDKLDMKTTPNRSISVHYSAMDAGKAYGATLSLKPQITAKPLKGIK